MYYKKQGKEIIAILRNSGLEAYLIGSIEKKGRSLNDVDILLIDPPKTWRGILDRLLKIRGKSKKNDWGGAVFITEYGIVDIFVKSSNESKK